MDADGRCIEQPYDDIANPSTRSRERCRTRAYPVRQAGGLLWAYMGPEPAPELPVWEPLTWPNGFAEIVISEVPCNWLQCQENSCDPVHFEWMHENWNARLKDASGPYAPRHLKLKFEEFEHGFIYKRMREGADEADTNWTIGRVTLWPNGFYLSDHFEWRVPIDDTSTLSVAWFYTRVPREREPYVQGPIPTWHGPIKDPQGRWITSHVINQDIIAWVGQGAIADRSQEHLGASDLGIAMIRKRFFDELAALAKGAEPKGIVRNPNVARCVELPNMERARCVDGVTRAQFETIPILKARLQGFRWQYGQPPEVRRAFEAAIGISPGSPG
jgi:5,5'-dehydrodivanillate O-demethylase